VIAFKLSTASPSFSPVPRLGSISWPAFFYGQFVTGLLLSYENSPVPQSDSADIYVTGLRVA
jgi:hypothetical protein